MRIFLHKYLQLSSILFILFLAGLFSGCQPSFPSGAVTIAPTTATSTLESTPTQPALSMQYEITQADNGRTFTYNVTTRFTVFLDSSRYPKDQLKCLPDGIIGSISNIPPFQPPQYVVRYETIQAGECTLQDRDFQVKIKVVP